MEWDGMAVNPPSGSEGEYKEEKEAEEGVEGGFLLGNGGCRVLSFAAEAMLCPAASCGLVVTDALEADPPIIYVNRGFEEAAADGVPRGGSARKELRTICSEAASFSRCFSVG